MRKLVYGLILSVIVALSIVNFTELPYTSNKTKIYSNHFIEPKILKQKITAGLPAWATAQIHHDLLPFDKIKSSDLDVYFKENASPHNQLVRFQIRNGKLSLSKSPYLKYKLALEGFYKAIEYLNQQDYLPDTDFILGMEDYLIVKSPYAVPIFSFAKDLQIPLENQLILLPDWMNLLQAPVLAEKLKTANLHPWQSKLSMLLWRGGIADSTGFRHRLVNFAYHHPERLNVKFSMPPIDQAVSNNNPYLSIDEQLNYKYLMTIDGARCAWDRLVWQLKSGSLVFKHQSTQVQWFYKGLTPFKEYIPVTSTADVLEKLDWADTHTDKAQKITQQAQAFVIENLSLEDMYSYLIHVIRAYSAKLERE